MAKSTGILTKNCGSKGFKKAGLNAARSITRG